ncbi:MAG: hypothetical protein KF851_00205 [Pirellulaceae bacterium]|nr:hypothetical protein [Pirellulaceae bacterium]
MSQSGREKWLSEKFKPAESGPGKRREYPRYVYGLAWLYYLSLVLGPCGFFVCLVAAWVVWYLQRPLVDLKVIGWFVAALLCPALAAVFRWLFVRWGRWRWPMVDS